jgi:hypothetical protein
MKIKAQVSGYNPDLGFRMCGVFLELTRGPPRHQTNRACGDGRPHLVKVKYFQELYVVAFTVSPEEALM